MRNIKILIVDFDEEVSRYLSKFLKAKEFDVSIASDGEAGLEKCKAEIPDLVIVEPMISKLHGFELCSIITNDFNGKIPVVILTKFYREEQFKIEAMRSYGASAFLSKPFKGPEILETIKNLLKDKINEDEEEDMAEDMHALDDISEDGLNTLEIAAKSSKSEKSAGGLEPDILESLITPEKAPESQSEKAAVDSKIDKMLEDTLSEFGLNVDKKAEDKTKFLKKMDVPVDEINRDRKTIEPKPKKPEIPEPKSIKNDEEILEVIKQNVKEPEIKEPDSEVADVKEPETEEFDTPDVVEQLKNESEATGKKERAIFSAESEDEKKASILEHLKNSLGFFKKNPLKLLIPSVLIAAIAVSASFVFRKPSNPNPSLKPPTATLQPKTSQEMTSPENNIIENPGKIKEPETSPDLERKKEKPVEERESSDNNTQEGSVMTRVSQVFQVKEPEAQEKPDINPIDLEEAVLSTEPTVEIAAPILSETETVKIPEANTESGTESRADLNAHQKPIPEGESRLQPEEVDNPPAFEKPKTRQGDLVSMSEVDIPPEIAKRIEPKYPSFALSRGVGGKVILNVLISETGDVIETALLRGIKGPFNFNEECEKAIRQWKFVPAFKDGIKVKVWKTLSFEFKKL